MCWTWHFYTDVEPKVKNVGSTRSVIKHYPTMTLSLSMVAYGLHDRSSFMPGGMH